MNKAQAQSFKERRQSIRAKRVLSIEYRLAGKKNERWNLSTTEDMSLGGLSFYSEEQYRSGAKLEIHVVMSGVLDIYKGNATVVRSEKRSNGVVFLVAVKFDISKRPASSYKAASKAKSSTKKSA